MKIQNVLLATLVSASIIFSCSEDDSSNGLSYTDLFENTSLNIIQPSYKAYKTSSTDLQNDINTFINNPDQGNLTKLRETFVANYKRWQHTSLFEFGPALDADILLKTSVNSYPTKPSIIEGNISSNSYDLDGANNIFASGLPAIEYLIYGIGKSDSDIILDFSTNSDAQNRKQYLSKLIESIVTKITLASERWQSDYHSKYISNSGTGNSSSLTLLFNAYLKDYEETKRNKFALPAGYATEYSIAIPKDVNKLEGKLSNLSFDLIKESVKAHRSFFQGIGHDGIDGIGFMDKLIELKAKSSIVDGDLSTVSLEQLGLIKTNLETYSSTLESEINSNSTALKTTNLTMQKLVPMIKIDMKSYFGVPVTSQDTDGD